MHPLLGGWILDETVRVVFEILLHIVATLWAEASQFSLMLWRAKYSLDHYQYAITISPSMFFFFTSCHKWAVYADLANTRLSSPVVRRFVWCCPTFPESYRAFLTHVLWRKAYLTYWVGSGQKATTQTVSPLDFLSSVFVSSLVSALSVVVTKVVFGKWVKTKTETFFWKSRASKPCSSWGSTEWCCILMLNCFYTHS